MSAELITARIREELAHGPLTDDELAARLGVPRALIRGDLAALVFEHRSVTFDPDGRSRLGTPPESWPRTGRTP